MPASHRNEEFGIRNSEFGMPARPLKVGIWNVAHLSAAAMRSWDGNPEFLILPVPHPPVRRVLNGNSHLRQAIANLVGVGEVTRGACLGPLRD